VYSNFINMHNAIITCTLLQQLHWLPNEHHINFKTINITFRTLHYSQLPIYIQPCMLITLLILSGCQISICCLFHLFTLHSPLAPSALQLAKSRTLSLSQHFECVPAWTPFIIISRLTIPSRPSTPLNAFLLAPQIIRLLLTIVHVHKLYLIP